MHVFSSPSFVSSSFYVRLAISPCGRYLAAGSSGSGYNTHIWDLKTQRSSRLYGETKEAGVVLKGHTGEVGGVDWAGDTVRKNSHPTYSKTEIPVCQLATCGDDYLVRLWRPNAHTSNAARLSEDNECKWRWSGTWDQKDKSCDMGYD